MTWHSIVKIQQSLYREAPGLDPFRPDQKTPVRVPLVRTFGKYLCLSVNQLWAAVLPAPMLSDVRTSMPSQVPNFFLAGSYTKQDYIDSMEGATLSGRQCAAAVLAAAPQLAASAAGSS